MPSIVVVDYGAGNLHSVTKALEAVAGASYKIIIGADAHTILAADKIVFPGQGAIAQCMQQLRKRRLDEAIMACIANKPFLGICLGLQSLLDYSEEDNDTKGLGVIAGRVLNFANYAKNELKRYKIPHMGWSPVYQRKPHSLWKGIQSGAYFYFAHSYFVQLTAPDIIAGETDYICRYAAAVAHDNLFAVQFHPEKSQRHGLLLLKNFIDWDGA